MRRAGDVVQEIERIGRQPEHTEDPRHAAGASAAGETGRRRPQRRRRRAPAPGKLAATLKSRGSHTVLSKIST